ncbi:MAG: hypothetical protein KH131_05550, partial [Faecalibacterium prausnitzii]|nr:hypothetical protein [Faecalibacterium prausnitzii]
RPCTVHKGAQHSFLIELLYHQCRGNFNTCLEKKMEISIEWHPGSAYGFLPARKAAPAPPGYPHR